MSGELDEVARELYQLPPNEFTGVRGERVAQARERGDRELAKAIGKLRKPTLAAWALNRVAVADRERLEQLVDVGDRLRSAQRSLRADDLRELDRQRSRLHRDLVERAAALAEEAGQELGNQARQQVEQTLNAALSDPGSAGEVRAGTLAKPLDYSGFGLDELSAEAVRRAATRTTRKERETSAKPSKGAAKPEKAEKAKPEKAKPEKAKPEPSPAPAKKSARKAEEKRPSLREKRLAAARGDRDEAVAALQRADDEFAQARQEHRAAERRVDELQEETRRAERELEKARRTAEQAERRRDRAERQRSRAEDRVADLEE
ncbi:hypothetical protein A8924_5924 [Saccharopolyspora erythraea NRRL 2338]|uniref:Uncharacterized protein n=2 Tax=Saccharopolyspora erythraea TaxID=1836 RepID=A4FL45_SACEN|nr:hypothetical protein [Saccharopolyspora erythraea]EQD83746.1 hypothetical protein N599_23625 [Saccharopolyspora erythraea D]PFG98410.1 hypothetical protein A8924_5924 [Saccharopolyspora erythraea NRRL 2338]QRK88478.1 hypothetical protein JQX30_28005 [Saccharopolyspora erythraea]CAM04770.1 hypothetical protein SACE_5584 [Saccharopolyspora erythraea NRRL 2338]